MLNPGQSLSFQVGLLVPQTAAPGQYVNVTSELTSLGMQVAAPATDTLIVLPEPATLAVLLAGLVPAMLRRRR